MDKLLLAYEKYKSGVLKLRFCAALKQEEEVSKLRDRMNRILDT